MADTDAFGRTFRDGVHACVTGNPGSCRDHSARTPLQAGARRDPLAGQACAGPGRRPGRTVHTCRRARKVPERSAVPRPNLYVRTGLPVGSVPGCGLHAGRTRVSGRRREVPQCADSADHTAADHVDGIADVPDRARTDVDIAKTSARNADTLSALDDARHRTDCFR